MKANNSRMSKAIKSYNYEKMRNIELTMTSCNLMFYSSSIELMSKAIEN
jgi:hypothetical protein